MAEALSRCGGIPQENPAALEKKVCFFLSGCGMVSVACMEGDVYMVWRIEPNEEGHIERLPLVAR